MKVPGVEKVVVDRGHARAGKIPTARRRRGGRTEYLGGDARPRRAQDHLGRRPACGLRFRDVQGRDGGNRAQARTVVRNDGDAEKALAVAAKVVTARILSAPSPHAAMEPVNATASFADGKLAVWCPVQSPGGHGGTRQEAQHQARGRDGQRDAAGRRLRAQVEVRLRHRSGAAVQGGGRAGQGHLEPRGRHPARLFPYGVGGADRCRAGSGRQGGGLAPSQRGADHPVDLRAGPEARGGLRAGHGARRQPLRHRQSALRDRRGEAHTRIGWFRSVSNIPHAFAVQTMAAEIAAASHRIPRTCCSS